MNALFSRFVAMSTFVLTAITIVSCGSSNTDDQKNEQNSSTHNLQRGNTVVIHELSDPDMLNPATSSSANSTYIQYNLFMYLLDVDKESLELSPSLAKSRPDIREIEEGKYKGGQALTYEIRPEAEWDNGEPVTAHDVAFTYKAIKNPLTDAENKRPYLKFIDGMTIDEDNPRKFTIYSKEPYFMAEFASGNTYIMPEHIYDSSQIMRKFDMSKFSTQEGLNEIRNDEASKRFADAFNSEKFQRKKGYVKGCGPYKFVDWETGQRVILKKKKDWWGQELEGEAYGFTAHPDQITYEIINDMTTTLSALKDENLDLARSIRPKDYANLKDNESFRDKYKMAAPTQMSFTYIGMNMNHPILGDRQVRKAMTHLVNKERIIEVLRYGYAKPTVGPIHPSKPYYNDTVERYKYDLQKAMTLLDEAGWKDSNGNGIRDKKVDGKRREMELTYKYNSGNDSREKIGLMLKQNAKKAGIDVEVLQKEWTVYLEEVKNHNFDMFCLGWVQDPIIDDLRQIWHTESYNGGSNYIGFGDSYSDQLIDSINTELNKSKRNKMYKEMQAIIHKRVPYIFLYTPQNLLTIHQRFTNTNTYLARPGYTAREFRLKGQAKP